METQIYAIISDLLEIPTRIQSDIASAQTDWDDSVYANFASSAGGRFNRLGSQFRSNTIALSMDIDQDLGEMKKLLRSLNRI